MNDYWCLNVAGHTTKSFQFQVSDLKYSLWCNECWQYDAGVAGDRCHQPSVLCITATLMKHSRLFIRMMAYNKC